MLHGPDHSFEKFGQILIALQLNEDFKCALLEAAYQLNGVLLNASTVEEGSMMRIFPRTEMSPVSELVVRECEYKSRACTSTTFFSGRQLWQCSRQMGRVMGLHSNYWPGYYLSPKQFWHRGQLSA